MRPHFFAASDPNAVLRILPDSGNVCSLCRVGSHCGIELPVIVEVLVESFLLTGLMGSSMTVDLERFEMLRTCENVLSFLL